jgi:GT2 family glycosyltransferase
MDARILQSASPTSNRVTVVVLTYNRAREVVCTVRNLLNLPERPRIVVADNASTDDTVARIATLFPDVEVVRCPRNLGAAGRNHAVARVRTEYVAFCDDDMWWAPGSLAAAVELLAHSPDVAVLVARILVGESLELDSTCAQMQASPLGRGDLPGPSLVGFMAGSCVFRTAIYRRLGGYEPKFFIGGEEELLTLDVLTTGYAIVYAPRLVVHHYPSAVRDSGLRRRLLARNAAWVAWLRLPWREAREVTWRSLVLLWREGMFLRDIASMCRGLPWTLRHRQVVPATVLALRECVRRR